MREFRNSKYIHLVAEDNKALKVGTLKVRDITIIGEDTDISKIKEVDLKDEK